LETSEAAPFNCPPAVSVVDESGVTVPVAW